MKTKTFAERYRELPQRKQRFYVGNIEVSIEVKPWPVKTKTGLQGGIETVALVEKNGVAAVGKTISHCSPALAEYAEMLAPIFPVDASTTCFALCSSAFETSTVLPLSAEKHTCQAPQIHSHYLVVIDPCKYRRYFPDRTQC